MQANVYLISASAYIYVGYGLAASLPTPITWSLESLCALLFLVVMAPLCTMAYRATIRQSPTADAAVLVANAVQFVALAFLSIKCPETLESYVATTEFKVGTASMVQPIYVFAVLPFTLFQMANSFVESWKTVAAGAK